MNAPLEKFARAVSAIEADRGPFVLCGLFERADNPEVWDFVVSAPWLDDSRLDGMRYLARQLGDAAAPDEMLLLSRIVPIQTGDLGVNWLADQAHALRKPALMTNFDFQDEHVLRAYILSASRAELAAPGSRATA